MSRTRLQPWKVTEEGGSWFVHEPSDAVVVYAIESEARYRAAHPLVLDLVQRINASRDTMTALKKRAGRIAAVMEGRS